MILPVAALARPPVKDPGGASWDNDPDVNQRTTVRIAEIRAIDPVESSGEADFYVRVRAFNTYYNFDETRQSTTWSNDNHIYPNWEATFDNPDNCRFFYVTIQLYEDDYFDNTMDITGVPDESAATVQYDAWKGKWTGADYLGDPNGYGHVSGVEDGSEGDDGGNDQDDCELWFNIYTNEADHDGLNYYTEVYVTWTYTDDSDSDNDGLLDGEGLWRPTFDPWSWNDPAGDADGDGLTNAQEINTIDRSRATRISPIDADTDDDNIEDGRDKEPTRYNRRYAYLLEVTQYPWPYEDLSEKYGDAAWNLDSIGFDRTYLVTDHDYSSLPASCVGIRVSTVIELVFTTTLASFAHNTVDTWQGKEGDDIVLFALFGHGSDISGWWMFAFGDGTLMEENELQFHVGNLKTVDLVFLWSCHSAAAFDQWDGDETVVEGSEGVDNSMTLWSSTFYGSFQHPELFPGVGADSWQAGLVPVGSFESIYPYVRDNVSSDWRMQDNYPGNLYIS